MEIAKTDDYTPSTLDSGSLSAVQQESGEGQRVGSVAVPASGAPLLLSLVVRAKREWEATFDAVSDLIVLTDEQGIIRRCNRAVREALQTPYRDIVGRSIGEVFYGTREAVPLLFLKQSSIRGERQEMQFPRLPGWFAVGCHLLRTTENGGISGVVYTFTDITERKRAEAAHQQEAQVTAALARVGRELIATLEPSAMLHRLCQLACEVLECDASYTFLYDASRHTYTVMAGYGGTPEQGVAMKVLSLPQSALRPLVRRFAHEDVIQLHEQEYADIAPLLSPVRPATVLCMALRRGEQVIGVQTASYHARQHRYPLLQKRIAGGVAQLASLALENARLLEEAERANRLKSDFLATMSHELRTPLNIILGYNELLLEGDFGRLTAEQVECLRRVGKSAEQLLALINTILDVSRLETDRLGVEVSAVDINELLEEIRAETASWGREKPQVRVVWRIAKRLPPVLTDRAKLKVIIAHVFSNALKFTDQGRVTVTVSARDGGIVIRVTDTGVGIAPDTLPLIFEMFRQGENVLTRRHGGVGIGLYVVRRLLTLLGGTISVQSEVGRGSTFCLWVPPYSATCKTAAPFT